MDTWQLVQSDGEIVEADDASTVSQEWSVMDEEEAKELNESGLTPAIPEESTNQRLSSASFQNHEEAGWQDAPCRNRRSHKQRLRRTRRELTEGHAATTVASMVPATPSSAAVNNTFAIVSARTAQRQTHSRNRGPADNLRPAPPTDRKHQKCIFSGAMIGNSYQRIQAPRMPVGGVMRDKKVRA